MPTVDIQAGSGNPSPAEDSNRVTTKVDTGASNVLKWTTNGGTTYTAVDNVNDQTVAGAKIFSTLKDSVEVVTATNVITAAESGTVFFLNSGTEFVSTLPAPAAGLKFTFIVKAAPASASYTIVSASGTDNIHGVAVSAADAGGSVDTTAGTAADTITFVDGQAQVGDRVDLVCDGTLWYAMGFCSDEDAITFTAS